MQCHTTMIQYKVEIKAKQSGKLLEFKFQLQPCNIGNILEYKQTTLHSDIRNAY